MLRLLTLTVVLAAAPAAQTVEPVLRVLTREDGRTFVYHTLPLAGTGGVVLTREGPSGTDTLTAEPLAPAASAGAFYAVAPRSADLLMTASEAPSREVAFLQVRASPLANVLLSYQDPDVARGLGRLVVDSGAPAGQTVTYRAVAVDDLGRPTGAAAERTVTLDPRRPAPPTLGALDHEGQTVTVRWTYPENGTPERGEDDGVVRFQLVRLGAGVPVPIETPRPITRTDNETDYSAIVRLGSAADTLAVAVVAVDAMGQESAPSASERYNPLAEEPPPPLDGVAADEDGEGGVEVTWPVSTTADAVGYHVLRAPRVAGPYERVSGEPLGLLQTVFVDRPAPGAYFYAVAVVDASGNVGRRSGGAAATVPDRTPPPPPTNLAADATAGGEVALSWTPPSVGDFAGVLVLRRRVAADGGPYRGGQADLQLTLDPIRAVRYLDDGTPGELQEGAFYRFGVVARDTASLSSDTASVVLQIPDATPPPAPAALTAEVDDDARRTVLLWQPSLAADVGGYRLYRDGATLAATGPGGLRHVDTTAAEGVRYTYAVAAVDTLGNEGPRSEPVAFARADPDPPRVVYNVRARFDGAGVRVTWPALAEDDLAGYRVEAADIPTGRFEPVTDLTSATEYRSPSGAERWYRIVAVDTSGNEGRPSEAVRALR